MSDYSHYDNVFEPVLVEDLFGKIVYFNSSLLSFFKLTPRYFKKQDEAEVFFKEYVASFLPLYQELKSKSEILSPELEFLIEDSKTVAIIKGIKEGECLHFYFKDMTVENMLYQKYKIQVQELKKTHTQIIQSDKLKVIGEMTANISHEINNPLTVAMGNSEMIEFTLELPDINVKKNELIKFNQNISSAISRITKIIANMKEFLHNSEDQKEYYSIVNIINITTSFLTPILERNKVVVKLEHSDLNLIVFGNQAKLEQVFVNLIQNSMDALVESKTKNPEIVIKLHNFESKGMVAIDISDNGPGISKENQDKIFNTFFTTKEIGKGTGLGLSISNRIIESHQGKLELIPTNVGATFRINLPSVSVMSYVSGDWEKMHSSSNAYKKILIVDNDPTILNLCLSFLKNTDFYFLGATSASEALSQLGRINVDLIVTDLKMPNMSGEDFVKALRAQKIDTPVLYMTAKENIQQFNKDKSELKVNGIILKPFTKSEFIKTIESVGHDK